jgi:hypothetical protein
MKVVSIISLQKIILQQMVLLERLQVKLFPNPTSLNICTPRLEDSLQERLYLTPHSSLLPAILLQELRLEFLKMLLMTRKLTLMQTCQPHYLLPSSNKPLPPLQLALLLLSNQPLDVGVVVGVSLPSLI